MFPICLIKNRVPKKIKESGAEDVPKNKKGFGRTYGLPEVESKGNSHCHKCGGELIKVKGKVKFAVQLAEEDSEVPPPLQEWRCRKCKTKALYAPGIGHYCPKKGCENCDWGIERVPESKKEKTK